MNCKDCPYIIEEYEYKKRILHDDDIQYFCWCDKVGGKIWRFGMCEYDKDNTIKKTTTQKYVKRSKRERNKRYKNKMKNLTYNVRYYSCPINPVGVNGKYDVKHPSYFKRYSFSKRKYYLQRQSNKRIRKVPIEENISNGCSYKKYFELEWELF